MAKLKTTVKGYGGVVKSWRDLGREGHGGAYAGASPYARQGIFIQGHEMTATREAGPGLSLSRRKRLENPGLKKKHEFVEINMLCLTCNMMKAGHERLMGTLAKRARK